VIRPIEMGVMSMVRAAGPATYKTRRHVARILLTRPK
jgi:predicted fused transcriptional regulator/phosphomethylpyrimidine kinase